MPTDTTKRSTVGNRFCTAKKSKKKISSPKRFSPLEKYIEVIACIFQDNHKLVPMQVSFINLSFVR